MTNKVKFQCKEGQSIRKQPSLFMAELKDAVIWQELGIGFIVQDSITPKIQEDIESVDVEQEVKGIKTKKGVKNA